jgi:hypothetical protein
MGKTVVGAGPLYISNRDINVSYLIRILKSSAYEVLLESPLQPSEKTGVEIWLKLPPWGTNPQSQG